MIWPALLGGAAAGAAAAGYKKEKVRSQKQGKRERKRLRAYEGKLKDPYYGYGGKEGRAGRKSFKHGLKRELSPFPQLRGHERKAMEKEGYKAISKAMKGQHVKFNRLAPEQRKLFKEMGKGALKDTKGMTPLNKIEKPSETGLYRRGKNALKEMLSGKPQETNEFERYRKNITRQFNEEILPQLEGSYAGRGGGQGGSFQNALAGAGGRLSEHFADVAEQLAEKHQQQANARQEAAIGPSLTFAQMPLNEQASLRQMQGEGQNRFMGIDKYMQAYMPPALPQLPGMPPQQRGTLPGYQPHPNQPGFLHSFVSNMAQPFGEAAGTAMGGQAGGYVGSKLGSALSTSASQPSAGSQMPALPPGFGNRAPAFNPTMRGWGGTSPIGLT